MRSRRKFLYFAGIVAVSILAGCGKASDSSISKDSAASTVSKANSSSEMASEPTIELEESVDSSTESEWIGDKLIGLWKDDESIIKNYVLEFMEDGTYYRGSYLTDFSKKTPSGSWFIDEDGYLVLKSKSDENEENPPSRVYSIEINDGKLVWNWTGSSEYDPKSFSVATKDIFPCVCLTDGDAFSDGAAWVKYTVCTDYFMPESSGLGILKADGEIIPVTLPKQIDGFPPAFSCGYSYINYKNENNVSQYIILDADGKVSAKSSSDTKDISITVGDDGYFLVKTVEASIDEYKEQYEVINGKGEKLIDLPATAGEYSYLGFGWFQSKGSLTVFNAKTGCEHHLFYEDNYWDHRSEVLGVYNGSLIYSYKTDGKVWRVDPDGSETLLCEVGSCSPEYSEGIILLKSAEGMNKFIDTTGRLLADYGKYRVFANSFGGEGNAATIVIGADGYHYLVGIIHNFEVSEFEPIKLESIREYHFRDGIFEFKQIGGTITSYIDVEGNVTKNDPRGETKGILMLSSYDKGDGNVEIDGMTVKLYLSTDQELSQ